MYERMKYVMKVVTSPFGLLAKVASSFFSYWFPKSTSLSISSKNVSKLSALDAGLEELHLYNLPALTELSIIGPKDLKVLSIHSCSGLTKIDSLPTTLTCLRIRTCLNLLDFPLLPSNIQHIDITGSAKLKRLTSPWPSDTIILSMSDCRALTKLPDVWPNAITTLNMSDCHALTTLPAVWPNSITTLSMSGCHALTTLPDVWPNGLISLDFSRCDSLKTLPDVWPNSITTLNMSSCYNIKALTSAWPNGLISLDLSHCYDLKTLPALPASLQNLDLRECNSLELTEDLKEQLEILKAAGCNIQVPRHFSSTHAKTVIATPATPNQQACTQQPASLLVLGDYVEKCATARNPRRTYENRNGI